jgi:hypothetical protein
MTDKLILRAAIANVTRVGGCFELVFVATSSLVDMP